MQTLAELSRQLAERKTTSRDLVERALQQGVRAHSVFAWDWSALRSSASMSSPALRTGA